MMKPHIRMTDNLGELLGQYQDYSVLKTRIGDAQADAKFDRQRHRLMRLINVRKKQIRKEVFYLGSFVLTEKPRRLADRWEGYWNAWNASTRKR